MSEGAHGHDRLGTGRLETSRMGFGAMPLSGVYGEVEDDASMALLRHVVDSGVNLIDTSNSYGDGHNESLIGDALVDRRDRIVLATKFGMQGPGWGRRDRMREALDASLHRLQTDRIDLYYLHRVDRTTSIEATVEAMAELVDEGLIGGIGLSEISAETLIRAESIHPIAAVQQEYSLFTRDVEHELLPTMRELGIPLVAYSPLGRGILTGALRSPADLPENDERRTRYPRFDAGNLEANLAAAQALFDLADERGEHPTALALGWLLAQGEDIIPIPGTRRASNFDANLAVTRTQQDPEMVSALTGLFPLGQAKGDRYSAAMMAKLDG